MCASQLISGGIAPTLYLINLEYAFNTQYWSPNKISSIARPRPRLPRRPRAQISVTVDDLTKDDRDRRDAR